MEEKVLNAMSEIEDILLKAIEDCPNQTEASATILVIAAGFSSLSQAVLEDWSPRQKQEECRDENGLCF